MPEYGEWNGKKYDGRHGGAFDRGSADSWYDRGRNPHYYVGNTGFTDRVEEKDMTPEEIEAYHAGYDYNESHGGKKDYE